MQKPKRVNKTKDEIALDMRVKSQFKNGKEVLANLQKDPKFLERMKFTKEVFMPALIKASTSIDDAKMFLNSTSSMIMQKALEMMKEKKMADINFLDNLDKEAPKYKEVVALLELFKDYSIFDVRTVFESMSREIDMNITDELRSRNLNSLKVTWLDEKYGDKK